MSNATPPPLRQSEPLDPEQIQLVRDHLSQILASRTFAGSKRSQAFLELVVKRALEGDTDNLHERAIGAELFGRPISYDTGNDSVVRVRASELRKKLTQYYNNECGKQDVPVRIELHPGSYVPRFLFVTELEPSVSSPPAPALSPAEAIQPYPVTVESVPNSSAALGKRLHLLRFVLPALIVALLIPLSWIFFHRTHKAPTGAQSIRSIAVLPFDNLSGTPNQDFFADGLTEELINDLGQISTLRITSFTSSMSFKGSKKQLPEIAKELGVDAVVEGGLLRDGNQVRISVQLVDARDDRPVWASSYVQDVSSVFAWQGEVAQSIAEEISTEVTPAEQAQLARKSSVNAAAQDLYLHGLLLRNESNCGQAIDYFRQAIDRSPNYAEAHAALASCYGMLGESGKMTYDDAFTRQKEQALKAITLDDSLSEAHAELANTAMTLDRNWPTAAAEFRRALALNPSSATNHEKYAFYLVRVGQSQQAIAQAEQSVELDPVSGSALHTEGFIYYFAHHYNRALTIAQTVQGLRISLPDWEFLQGAIYAAKDMYPQSIKAFLQSGNGPYTLGHLGNVYARDGRKAAARKMIQRLKQNVQKDGVGRYEIALVYAGLGDKDRAFQWLDAAYQAHDVGLVYLKVDPCLNPLRSDPRFAVLLQREGLGG
jgi:TolB-like protein